MLSVTNDIQTLVHRRLFTGRASRGAEGAVRLLYSKHTLVHRVTFRLRHFECGL